MAGKPIKPSAPPKRQRRDLHFCLLPSPAKRLAMALIMISKLKVSERNSARRHPRRPLKTPVSEGPSCLNSPTPHAPRGTRPRVAREWERVWQKPGRCWVGIQLGRGGKAWALGSQWSPQTKAVKGAAAFNLALMLYLNSCDQLLKGLSHCHREIVGLLFF